MMNRSSAVGSVVVALLGLACAVSASAGQVFECPDATGKVTYSNVPCGVEAGPAASQAEPSSYETFYGEWQGQTQFQETVSGGPSGTARLMTPLSLKIEAGGKVTGATRDFGCRILGVARRGLASTEPDLDLTVSACKDRAFNRKYTGALVLYARQQYATIHLHSGPPPLFGKPAAYEIAATLRR